jgi:para-nitrobenzyl esterase
MAVKGVDEDCLTLNVWCPARPAAEPRPVMVWIYGGAFVTGGSALATYDGARLAAEQDVIVVTVNYRIGALGFLDLRSIPGGETADTNCGLRDQVLALQWIQRHIGSLGGDPSRVTVFGESAGAGSIMHLLTVPGIEALVRRAIVQSPGIDFTQTSELSAVVATTFVARAGVSTVDELRRLPAARIVELQEAVAAELLFDVGTMVFHPVIDGELVPASPSVAIGGGAASGVDLVLGYTADEMRLFPDPRADDLGEGGLTAWVRSYLTYRMGRDPGDGVAGALVRSYVTAMSGTSRSKGSDHWAAITTDGIMRQPVLRVADSRAAATARTYVYQFDWQSRRPGHDLGAFHAIELPFVFDAFDVDGWDSFVGVDDAGRRLASAMRSAWAAFAATGDPSGAALGSWPPYDASRHTMVLNEQCRVVDDPLAAERGWWDGLWDRACRPAAVPQ